MKEVHGWLTSDGKFFPIELADEASKHQSLLDFNDALNNMSFASNYTIEDILSYKEQLKEIFDKLEL